MPFTAIYYWCLVMWWGVTYMDEWWCVFTYSTPKTNLAPNNCTKLCLVARGTADQPRRSPEESLLWRGATSGELFERKADATARQQIAPCADTRSLLPCMAASML